LRLSDSWKPERDAEDQVKPEGRLWRFVESIALSRREGKNRRDNASVGTRVLRLAQILGEEIFTDTAEAAEAAKVKANEEREKKARARL